MIVLAVTYIAKPGQGDAVAAGLRRMAPLVKQHEPGCVHYEASRSRDNADHFLLYEVYQDQAALDAHRETPHFKEIVEAVIPLLESRVRTFYDPV
jgi:autoinducer 2-degrading protein